MDDKVTAEPAFTRETEYQSSSHPTHVSNAKLPGLTSAKPTENQESAPYRKATSLHPNRPQLIDYQNWLLIHSLEPITTTGYLCDYESRQKKQ
jgi:hypothetical protein